MFGGEISVSACLLMAGKCRAPARFAPNLLMPPKKRRAGRGYMLFCDLHARATREALSHGAPAHTPSLEKWVWQSACVFVCCVLIARRGKKTVCVFFMPALGAAELDIAACKAPVQFALQGRGKEREELCSLSATLGRRGQPQGAVCDWLCPESAAPQAPHLCLP